MVVPVHARGRGLPPDHVQRLPLREVVGVLEPELQDDPVLRIALDPATQVPHTHQTLLVHGHEVGAGFAGVAGRGVSVRTPGPLLVVEDDEGHLGGGLRQLELGDPQVRSVPGVEDSETLALHVRPDGLLARVDPAERVDAEERHALVGDGEREIRLVHLELVISDDGDPEGLKALLGAHRLEIDLHALLQQAEAVRSPGGDDVLLVSEVASGAAIRLIDHDVVHALRVVRDLDRATTRVLQVSSNLPFGGDAVCLPARNATALIYKVRYYYTLFIYKSQVLRRVVTKGWYYPYIPYEI